jgi:hypothetical protein
VELKKGRGKRVRKSGKLSRVWLIELPTSVVSLLRRGQRPTFCGTRCDCDASGEASVIEFV